MPRPLGYHEAAAAAAAKELRLDDSKRVLRGNHQFELNPHQVVFQADRANAFHSKAQRTSPLGGAFPARAKGSSLQSRSPGKPGALVADGRFKEQMLASIGQGQTFQV